MFKYLLTLIAIVFLSTYGSAQYNVRLIKNDSIVHSGTGKPSATTINVGSGKKRVLVVHYFMERDLTNNQTNAPGGSSRTDNVKPLLNNTSLTSRVNNSMEYRVDGNNLFGVYYQMHYIRIPDDLVGSVDFDPGIVNSALNAGSDMIIKWSVFDNVSEYFITNNAPNGFGKSYKPNEDTTNNFYASNVSKFNATFGTNPILNVPLNANRNDLVYYAIGAINTEETLTAEGTGWIPKSNIMISNSNGSSFNLSLQDPEGRAASKEPNGLRFVTAMYRGAVPPELNFNRTNSDYALFGRNHVIAMLPLARPAFSGQVFRDVNQNGSIDGTGTNGGGNMFINVLDENNNIVTSVSVGADGKFSIPGNLLYEGYDYKFVLTNSSTSKTSILNSGWYNVGEDLDSAGTDGSNDGILTVTPGLTDLTTIRFGINICSAGSNKPTVANRNLSYTCPATGVNLANANVTTAPSGSIIVWFKTADHSGNALNAAEVASAAAGTYYAFYYDSVAGCYSLASDPVVVTSLCATDDNFSVSSGVTGGTAGNVLTNDRLNGVQPTTSNVSIAIVTQAAPINGSTNIPTIDASGNVIVPANTPGGTYNITYRICVIPAGTPCDDAIVKVTVPYSVQTTPDVVTTPAGVATSIPNVLSNDRYNYGTTAPVIGTEVTLSAVGTWPHGITLNSNGSVTVPNNVPVGSHTMQYQVCTTGATSECKIETVTVNVTNNPILTAVDDINQTEQNKPISGNVLTNDESSSSNTVTSATAKGPNGSTVTLTPGTSSVIYGDNGQEAGTIVINTDGTYTFTPKAEFVGDVSLNYTTNNTEGLTDSASLTIKVSPKVNVAGTNPPIAQNDVAFTEINRPVVISPKANDSDPSGNITSATISGLNQGGVAVTNGGIVSGIDQNGNVVANAGTLTFNSNGTYTFNPATGFVGTVNPISYTLTDTEGLTDTADMFITVEDTFISAQNNTYANDDAIVGIKGVILQGNVLTNDTDPEGNSQTVTSATVNGVPMIIGTSTTLDDIGRVKINADGSYAFSPLNPNTNFVGTITVVYTKCDNGNPQACDTATLYITALDTESICYKPANLTGVVLDTNVGISTIGQGENWPQNRKGAFIAIESKTKGLVIPRMTTAEMINIPNPQIGMTVFDTVDDCMKVYGKGPNNSNPGWFCFNVPACND